MLMKKNILLYTVAVAGLVLAGCNKDLANPGSSSDEIQVTASIGSLTKVAYDGDKSSFAKEDTIRVYAWTGDATEVPTWRVVNGVKNGFDGEVWTPKVQMLWKTVVDPHYFLGIYPAPAQPIQSFTADPYVQKPMDYEASDLLIATNVAGVKASDGKVDLAFDHAMAKLQVNLNFRSEWNETWGPVPAAEKVLVFAMAKIQGTVDYLKKEITATEQAVPLSLTLHPTAATGYTYSFSNLIIPQEAVVEIHVIVIEDDLNYRDFVYTHADKKGFSLTRGKVTSSGLKVGREQIDLAGITVDDWAAGYTPTTDGEALDVNVL